jgi:hypothetical protein
MAPTANRELPSEQLHHQSGGLLDVAKQHGRRLVNMRDKTPVAVLMPVGLVPVP